MRDFKSNQNLNYFNSESNSINANFFGPASFMDFIKDMEFSQENGINVTGKPRDIIKAEILSFLTGKPVDIMYNFFNATARLENYIDKELFHSLKISFTSNLNANKAIIINKLIELKNA